jgi:O-antigen/teichoic acid export membrane protein
LQGAAGGMAVGQFGVAATAMGPVRMLAMALSSIVRPRLALQLGRGELRAANRMLLHVCMLIASCGAAAVIAALLLGEWLVVTVFGAEFAAVGRLLPLAFVFAALEATAAILVVALQTLRGDGAATATRLRTIVSVLALLVVWPACHLASVAGAMTALCATELVFLALAHEALRRPQVGLDGR